MKKIVKNYIHDDSGEEMVTIEVSVDGLSEEQEDLVQQAADELTRYILKMKGIVSEACGGCTGC